MAINGVTLLSIAFAIMMVLLIICFILNAINSSKLNTIMDYAEDGDIIKSLDDYYNKISDLAQTINDASDAVIHSRLVNCENEMSLALKKTGIVNFDAFDDVKGFLSFALAILNDNNDGFILTSLYGHNSCNTYIREIIQGESRIKLLDEERQALEMAKNKLKRIEDQ